MLRAKHLKDRELLTFCLEGLAAVVTSQGEPVWAARLWETAETLRSMIGIPLPPVERAAYESFVTAARAQLGDHAFAAAWAEGHTMTPEQALASEGREMVPVSISPVLPLTARVPSTVVSPDGLTAREVELLRLVAQGLSDAEIAEQLIISLLTIKAHMRSLYNKLGISSRSAATRYAIEHHFI
jgi:ATP/maltotriose-dependent transcriptional regulator MalT